jgi:flagellar hook-associated protein 1 FlgK
VVAQLENQRDTVSAVSLDEEMANLIKFQRAFDAAARMVNTADEMFQTILNMV